MTITIRKETLKDYQQIAEVSLLSFRGHTPKEDFRQELILGDVLRHSSYYDNDLALVAEIDGKIVGYALFSPVDVYYQNNLTKSIILDPLAVHPDFQGKGIGDMLLNEGHRIAAEKGYASSLLFGEKDYYPRFGYIPKVFSYSGIKVDKDSIESEGTKLTERPVEPGDISTLSDIWKKWNKDEPIAVFPGNNFLDWVSHERKFRAVTILKNSELVGYMRYEIERPWVVMYFMAKTQNAMELLGLIKDKIEDENAKKIYISLNPDSNTVKQAFNCNYESNVNMSVHGMLKVLDEQNPAVKDYIEYIRASEENLAVIHFPPSIDWC